MRIIINHGKFCGLFAAVFKAVIFTFIVLLWPGFDAAVLDLFVSMVLWG